MNNVDPSEIVSIVQKYSGFVSAICRKYYIVGGTFDDLYEEGIIGILQACKNFKGESLSDDAFDPFVKLCIKRQIIDAIKNSNRKKNKPLNESISLTHSYGSNEDLSLMEILSDRNTSSDPLDLFIDKEKVSERLAFAQNDLSEFEKEVLKHYLSGEKQSEIAKSLNKNIKSIDNTIQRIKNKITKNRKNNKKI